MLLLYIKAYAFTTILTFSAILIVLNAINGASNLPLGMHDYSTLPEYSQGDLHNQTLRWHSRLRNWFPEKMKETAHVGVTFHVHDCEAHGAVEPNGKWEMEYNLCGEKELLDWCREDRFLYLYKTTGKIIVLSDTHSMHMNVSCFRVRKYSKYLARFLKWLPPKISFIVFMSILIFMRRRNVGEGALEQIAEIREKRRVKAEKLAQRAAAAQVVEQGHPDVKKSLMSRQGNFRKRRS